MPDKPDRSEARDLTGILPGWPAHDPGTATLPADVPGGPAGEDGATGVPGTAEAAAPPGMPSARLVEAVALAAERARDHLLGAQSPDGWWKGEFETNVAIDAEDILFREFLGVRTAEWSEQTARWIRARQHPEGWWANYPGGPPDLSTTVEGYLALRLAGDPMDARHMRRAAGWVRRQGGIGRSRVFTRIWLAVFGEWSWDDLPILPPEMLLLPRWFPLNVYDFACWARATIVPLTVIFSLRPARPLGFTIDELRGEPASATPVGWPAGRAKRRRGAVGRFDDPLLSQRGALARLDAALHSYERVVPRVAPLRATRAMSIRRACAWVISRQEADGSLAGIQLPSVFALIALHLCGYPLDHPALATGLRGLDRYAVVEDGPGGTVRRIEAAQSYVWDTALAVTALLDTGASAEHPALLRAARWLLGQEIRVSADWAVRRPGLAPGCWGFGTHNDRAPDLDDTAEVVMALHRLAGAAGACPAGPERELWSASTAAAGRGVAWAIGMQCRDGGWGAFDADNTRVLPTQLPFCDFGEVIDPPSADVTAHVLEMLAHVGRADSPAARRAVDWLLARQEADGSWVGRWGANGVYGVGAVVPALVAAGLAPGHPALRRAVGWLERHQQDCGGWGEDARSYTDPGWVGRGEPTASQTAWALLALLATDPTSSAVEAGVRWLVESQRGGTWDEPQFTGTGFPRDLVMIRYHLYRHLFPLATLGRFLSSRST